MLFVKRSLVASGLGIASLFFTNSTTLAKGFQNYQEYKSFCNPDNAEFVLKIGECEDSKSKYFDILERELFPDGKKELKEFKTVYVSDWRRSNPKVPWSEPVFVESDFDDYVAVYDKNYQKRGDGIFVMSSETGIISQWTPDELSIFSYSKSGCDALLGCSGKSVSAVGSSIEVLVDDDVYKIYGSNGVFPIPGSLSIALQKATKDTYITLRINNSIISDIGEKTSESLGVLFSLEDSIERADFRVDEKIAPVQPLAEANNIKKIVSTTTPGVAKIKTSSGHGSGFFISSSGLLLTNRHVVSGNKTVEVSLFDGSKYTARVLKKDRMADIALLKVDIYSNTISPLPLCFAQYPSVGEDVVAIGNPLSFNLTVTRGIVSGIRQTENQSLIQTDAPINPGNSGGPLLNQYGEVVGIINAKRSGLGIEGLGFAVPIIEALNNFGLQIEAVSQASNTCGNPIEEITTKSATSHE